ncbi:MAG: 4-hydroxythreonine-4-phosphate dehydrogenase PdxA [Pseudomonadota bacterium]
MAKTLITCGDPNGIGPEIILKSLKNYTENMLVVGDVRHFEKTAAEINIKTSFEVVNDPDDARTMQDSVSIWHHPFTREREPGVFNPDHARHIIAVLDSAISHCLHHKGTALVTAPINKAVLKEGAAFAFSGHTELLADRSGIPKPVMMIAGPQLKTVPATIHIPLSEVPSALSSADLAETIRVTASGLRELFDISNPRIVVAGLNPHAGEDGKIGTEEIDWIAKTIDRTFKSGINVTGPWPADTLFHAARRKTYDAAICMYHDQALIPVKALDFDEGVNVTLGLPFIRTSPDHGTAFDIAGKGLANAASFTSALKLASVLATKNG